MLPMITRPCGSCSDISFYVITLSTDKTGVNGIQTLKKLTFKGIHCPKTDSLRSTKSGNVILTIILRSHAPFYFRTYQEHV